MSSRRRPLLVAPRFTPLWGVLIGALGGVVYWIGTQLWPTSIAVILSMLATNLVAARMDVIPAADGSAPTPAHELLGMVFAVLVKYNALMALSAASMPFALPANLALGLIMIAGHAASRALLVSVSAAPASHADLGIALAIGFAPAVLIGIPGLIGLVAAIAARFVFTAYLRRQPPPVTTRALDLTQQLTEICFYLGALAAWAYA
jgi:adenosylcobinamide-GDP ribazoletransferase